MDRRSFIKLTAVTGGSAALAGCGHPEHQLVRFVPDEDIIPGAAAWKPGVCPLCSSGCGLTVRVMDADADVVRNGQAGLVRILAAKKLEGSPSHPVNQGGLCARGQAAIQVTYHPDRIAQPLKRTGERGSGRYEAVTWDAAIAEMVSRLDAIREPPRSRSALTCLSREGWSHRAALVSEFIARAGGIGPAVYDLFSNDVERRANAISFGRHQLPTVDLPNTRCLVSFGADFLGTWGSPVAQAAGYGAMRQGRAGIRGTFVQVEARMSQTGANADEWVPIRPGTEGRLALGLAHVLMSAKLRPASAGRRAASHIDGWSAGLPGYAPDDVEKATGVSAARIERLARMLAERTPAVAIAGGPALAHTNGRFTALAVNALNELLDAVDRPGGIFFTPQIDLSHALKTEKFRGTRSLRGVVSGLLEGRKDAPQVVLIDGANPVFATPPAWKLRDALLKAPFIASFSPFLDETSVLADLILPDHSFLESWSDALPESGSMVAVASAAPPVMRPLHDTRSTGDVLLEIGRKLRQPLGLPWETFEEMLAASFAALPAATPDADSWTDAQEKGGWWGTLPASSASPEVVHAMQPFPTNEPAFDGDPAQFPMHLLPYASASFLDGSLAHLPWLQELPDPITSAMWSSWIEINPVTAARLGVQQGDVVEVASSQGMLRTAAVISPGIAPDVVAMPVGQGHETFTRYASRRGENPVTLLAPLTEIDTGAVAWAATRVRVTRVGPPDGRLILFAGGMREQDEATKGTKR
jgi:anaerobic selenocysteine-containing dehydrogenase